MKKFSKSNIGIYSYSYSDTGVEILYHNGITSRTSLLLLTQEPLKNILQAVCYITDYRDSMVQVPSPILVGESESHCWIDTDRFMQNNLDDSMAYNLLLHYLRYGAIN